MISPVKFLYGVIGATALFVGGGLGYSMTPKPLSEVSTELAELDKDDDNVISTDEWRPHVKFKIDADGNGTLSKEEILRARQTLNQMHTTCRKNNLHDSSRNLATVILQKPFEYPDLKSKNVVEAAAEMNSLAWPFHALTTTFIPPR